MGSLYGYEISCDRPLERLSAAAGTLGELTVRRALDRPLDLPGAELGALTMSGEEWRPSHARAVIGSRLLTWHHDAGSFLGDPTAGTIAYRPEDGLDPDRPGRWEDRLGSTAIPLLLGGGGALPLHAAANLVGEGAVVICGVSGRGKSTLSAALAAAGHAALGEDGVVVSERDGAPWAHPGAPGSLIGEEAAAAIGLSESGEVGMAAIPADPRGRVLRAVPCAERAARVAAVVFLAERGGEAPELTPVGRAKCHRELINHTLAARPTDGGVFSRTARLAGEVDAGVLSVPDSLGAVRDAAALLASFAQHIHALRV